MPTVARVGPYRFFFFSDERNEPHHVHVRRDRSTAKFWLGPVVLAASSGFSGPDLNEIRRIVRAREREFMEAWDDHFGRSR